MRVHRKKVKMPYGPCFRHRCMVTRAEVTRAPLLVSVARCTLIARNAQEPCLFQSRVPIAGRWFRASTSLTIPGVSCGVRRAECHARRVPGGISASSLFGSRWCTQVLACTDWTIGHVPNQQNNAHVRLTRLRRRVSQPRPNASASTDSQCPDCTGHCAMLPNPHRAPVRKRQRSSRRSSHCLETHYSAQE